MLNSCDSERITQPMTSLSLTSHLVPPSDLVLADDGLHDGVEAALGRVQVAGHLRPLHLTLHDDKRMSICVRDER